MTNLVLLSVMCQMCVTKIQPKLPNYYFIRHFTLLLTLLKCLMIYFVGPIPHGFSRFKIEASWDPRT